MKRHQNELQRRAFKKGMEHMLYAGKLKFSEEDVANFFLDLKKKMNEVPTYDERVGLEDPREVKSRMLELLEDKRREVSVLYVDMGHKSKDEKQ